MEITRKSQNVSVSGHEGTWYTIDAMELGGREYFLMEHEKHGDEAACVILDRSGSLVLEDVANGFDDLKDILSMGNLPPVIGTLTFRDSGEVVEYTDAQKYVTAYENALDTMGPADVDAEIFALDIDTHYRITAALCDQFGEKIDKDIYFLLADQYGFDQPWPKDVMYHGTVEEWEEYYSKVQQEMDAESPTQLQRLFVDMDGTLAEFRHVDQLETLYEPGYFANLRPMDKVVKAVREIHANHPEIEVHILSAYLSDSPHALVEKNQWLDQHLPEIDTAHRVFVPCGVDKKEYVPGGIRPDDYLLDDYTHNLSLWEPPARGIKLMNGINHTKGTWQGDRIRFDHDPAKLADKLVSVMKGQAQIYDPAPSKEERDAFSLGVRTAQEIMRAGYQPYYNKGNLHIFQNPKTGGLQFYAVSFRKDKPGQLSFEKLDTKESLAPYKHLMPPEMQQSFSRAYEYREHPMEY